jgi:hypothetical protein
MAANLRYLLFGEGNVPWLVRELVRWAEPDPERRLRVVIGSRRGSAGRILQGRTESAGPALAGTLTIPRPPAGHLPARISPPSFLAKVPPVEYPERTQFNRAEVRWWCRCWAAHHSGPFWRAVQPRQPSANWNARLVLYERWEK